MAAIDLRYARALETVVSKQGLRREEVKQQLDDFVSSYQGSPQLREILGDPSVPQNQKVRVLDAMVRRMGLSGTVRNFLAVVTSHERLSHLPSIVNAYLQLADKDSGVTDAEITSARPLDQADRRALEASIAQLTGESQVRASYREDPSLLGGAVIRVGSTVYDGSVRGQLEHMKQRLVGAAS